MKTVSKKLLSILLVALLLVSAIPFQAFAESDTTNSTTVAHDSSNHTMTSYQSGPTGHWYYCTETNCEYYPDTQINFSAHSFSNGVCTICGYECQHTETTIANAKDATCVTAGYEGDTVCSTCGMTRSTGSTIPPTGIHTYVDYVCTVCGAKDTSGATYTLTLDANGGTINGGATMTVSVQQGTAISTLPDATREGFDFAGWFVNGTKLSLGQTYEFGADVTATAQWTEKTYNLTVRVVKNGVYSTAKTIWTGAVPAGTPLLSYLETNVKSTVLTELNNTPGYSWEYNFWKDYSGTNQLTGQDTLMNQAQTVYVNFVAKSYTLYFNANGGSVTPTSKTVYFGSAVGTLPTASLSGKVFQYWTDASGNIYTASTVYQVAGDTSLTAVYQDEALVILYIYINGDFSGCNRMIVMDNYVNNNNISRSDVYTQVAKYYTPASGTLSIAGLFDEYTWSSYRANTSKAGTENIEIDASKVNKIYVMVNNASTGTTVISGTTSSTTSTTSTTATTATGAYWVSTGNGTGYWVYAAPSSSTTATTYTYVIYSGTNPKTGDTAQIEVAAAIMVLAAGALVTLIALRKKKA